MKVREMIGPSVRTMVKVTMHGDQHQHMVNMVTEGMGERRRARSVQGRVVSDRVVITCAVMVYSTV